MDSQRLVLYDSEWQALRTDTLAQYNYLGGWTTLPGVVDNLRRLEEYLTQTPNGSPRFLRLWRTSNCLNAVRMGYSGQGLTGTALDAAVLAHAVDLRTEYATLRKRYGKPGIRHEYFETLQGYEAHQLTTFKALIEQHQIQVIENLSKRYSKHAEREELNWYLRLVAG